MLNVPSKLHLIFWSHYCFGHSLTCAEYWTNANTNLQQNWILNLMQILSTVLTASLKRKCSQYLFLFRTSEPVSLKSQIWSQISRIDIYGLFSNKPDLCKGWENFLQAPAWTAPLDLATLFYAFNGPNTDFLAYKGKFRSDISFIANYFPFWYNPYFLQRKSFVQRHHHNWQG